MLMNGTVFSFLTDFICAAFPIVLLRNLNIRRGSKIALCILMGLGIITGAIAVARTATAFQVKSDDLSWVGVPNAMTRIFEVNIGNIAACVPILKPFTRYVHAIITGRDPHQILRRKTSDNSLHQRWYARGFGFWTSRHIKGDSAYARQEPELPPGVGVVKMRPVASGNVSNKSEAQRSESLGLPMEGERKDSDYGESIPGVPSFPKDYDNQSDRGLRTDVKDLV